MIEYKPSLFFYLVKYFLIVFEKLLPEKVYIWLYTFLYNNYKLLQRKAFLAEVFFAKLSRNNERILSSKLTNQLLPFTMGGRKALENAFHLTSLVEEKEIEGALVECGVAEGGTAAMMALTNRKLGKKTREKWFFDSYEGLPEPTKDDYKEGRKGKFIRPLEKGSCLGTIEQVGELMYDNLGFNKEEVKLIKGWFQDTVPDKKKERFKTITSFISSWCMVVIIITQLILLEFLLYNVFTFRNYPRH